MQQKTGKIKLEGLNSKEKSFTFLFFIFPLRMLERVHCLKPLDNSSRHYSPRVLFPTQDKNVIRHSMCIRSTIN